MMSTRFLAGLMVAVVCPVWSATAGFVVTKIADNLPNPVTPYPVAVLRSTMAYADDSSVSIYKDGVFTPIVYSSNPVFGGNVQNIDALSLQVIDDNKVAFLVRYTDSKKLLFVADETSVTRLIPPTLVVSGITCVIESINSFAIDGNDVAISVWNLSYGGNPTNTANEGIYVRTGLTVERVVDHNTIMPNTSTHMTLAENLTLGRKQLTFVGVNEQADGGYLESLSRGHLQEIMGVGDIMPEQNVPLAYFHSVSSRRGKLAFVAHDSSVRGSVYRYYQDAITPIAIKGTVLPDGQGTVDDIVAVAFDGGNTAFVTSARTSNPFAQEFGIFASIGDRLWTVVPVNGQFDGREPYRIILGEQSMSGNAIVFGLQFRDGVSSMYRAELVFDQAAPAEADLDGDAQDDTAFFDPSTSTWYTRYWDYEFTTLHFGYPGVLPVAEDYDGDGTADVGVYDPNNGNWFVMGTQAGFASSQFGYPGTIPVPADYDGDGSTDHAVYDPRTGWWFILGTAGHFLTMQFGYPGVQPVPADFDGDGMDDVAVFDPNAGLWYTLESQDGFKITQFGYPGVTPVPEDFDGQGADFAVFDSRNGNWFTLGQVDGFQLRQFGYSGVIPVSADYDGDAKSDLGVYDPYRALWYLLRTSAGFRSGGL